MTFRSMTFPLFALVAALAGCSAEAGTSAGASSTDEARSNVVAETSAKAEGSKEGARMRPMAHHPPPGPDFLLHAALRAPIDLTPEQRTTIEGLVKEMAPRPPQRDAARMQKLAAAIRNNTVADLEAPKPDASAREARIAASAKALATLHSTLTPEQRAALVDSIEKRAAHGPKLGEHVRKDGAKRVRGERAEGAKPGFGRGFRPAGGPMGMLAGLDLTEEQKAAIEAKLGAQRPAAPTAEQREAMKAKMESMRAEMKAKLQSFKSDQFDATAFVTPPKDLAPPQMARHHKNPLAEITPILTPAQREILAARIEKGPVMRHAGHMKALKANAPQNVK
jgi:Spy/CpxP family protein refolding chaperone